MHLLEEILMNAEEHAEELAHLLFAVEPETGGAPRYLYFGDEVPAPAKPDKAVKA
jgi:hypothetical protein